ncbi:uncharacterized protein LOC132553005 [Ylistrum balloti]|uniref:uncharacterized protein LOC132553005 n=1 Tax=Ylistrum balloti TaxID=509963 RepID=UPI002905DD19|nr:uncharacterized protein LOC132553005 [Ylistrum balloti]
MPYSLEQEVAKILERRGGPIVCDSGNTGSIAFAFDTAEGTTDFSEQKEYAKKVVKFLPDNGNIAVAGLVYGGSTAISVPLGSDKSYDDLVAAIGGISQEQHGPRDEAKALKAAGDLLMKEQSDVKAIVLFVDGSANNLEKTKAAADDLRGKGFNVFLAFPKELFKKIKPELQDIASEPFSMTLNAMNSLGLAESLGIVFDVKYSC